MIEKMSHEFYKKKHSLLYIIPCTVCGGESENFYHVKGITFTLCKECSDYYIGRLRREKKLTRQLKINPPSWEI